MSEQTFKRTILNIEDAVIFVMSAKMDKSQLSELLTEIKKLEQSIVNRIQVEYLA